MIEDNIPDLYITKIDAVYHRLNGSQSVLKEISDKFTFEVPNYHFIKKKNNMKAWDGKIRLLKGNLIYQGLLKDIIQLCQEKKYTYEYEGEISQFSEYKLDNNTVKTFVDSLNLPKELHGQPFVVRDYQLDTLIKGSRVNQRLFISPTSSGKSLMIYMLTKLFKDKKILITVPTVSLVHQMVSDFKEYGSTEEYYKIYSGQTKTPEERIVVSTWQSIYNLDKKWFKDFDMVIGDEAHLYKAKSLTSIMEKLVNAHIRFGFTGTLDKVQVNEMTLKGLFGPKYVVTTIKELIENKQITNFNIKSVILKYNNEERQKYNSLSYKDELEYIIDHPRRNEFIKNLVMKLKGNSIVFYRFVEKHGKVIYELIKEELPKDRKVFFISGDVSGEERENIRQAVEKEKDCIIVASYGTTSTGVNIRKIDNLIFISPSKSRVKILQSIGRGLRLAKDKVMLTVYDIVDDLTWKTSKSVKMNHTFRHFTERLTIYNEEEFAFKMHTINI